MPAVKITQKPIGTPGDDTHFLVTQPELPEGYTPTGQETEEELAELKVESVREIEVDAMAALLQEKMEYDDEPTDRSDALLRSGTVKSELDRIDDDISSLNEDITNLETNKQDALTFDQTPTDESTNPVTSVGIKNAIEAAVDVTAPGIYETASGSIASFADGADDMPLKSCVVSLHPIQEGEGDPSPENVRPISGRTGLSVVRSGKNLFNPNSSDNLWVGANNALIHLSSTKSVTISAKAGQVLTASMSNIRTSSNLLILVFFDIGGNVISRKLVETGEKVLTATAPANTASVLCSLYTYSEAGDVQLEIGSTATDYEPYKGDTYTINWETEAGTVYGGVVDVISGKLTVNRGYKEFSTANGWSTLTTENIFRYASLDPAIKTVDTTIPVNAITNETNVTRYRYDAMKASYPSISADTTGRLYIAISDDVLTVEQLGTWLQTNPLQVCYEIAEPFEIQLTPQEVRTLLGENNIWSDGGDMSVEYPADTKLYIDQKIIEAVAAALA